MLAYYETVTSGIVKVRIVKRQPATFMSAESFECVVTDRSCGVYPAGFRLVLPCACSGLLPRTAVRKFKSSPYPKVIPFNRAEAFASV